MFVPSLYVANPLLQYDGPGLELLYPDTSITVEGLLAQYRLGDNQTLATSELSAYFYYNATRVMATDVFLVNASTRAYEVEFDGELPVILGQFELVVELDVTSVVVESAIGNISIPVTTGNGHAYTPTVVTNVRGFHELSGTCT